MQLRFWRVSFVVYLKSAHASINGGPFACSPDCLLAPRQSHTPFTVSLRLIPPPVAFNFAPNTMRNFLILSFACIHVLRLTASAKFSAFLCRAGRLLRRCSTLISGARHKQLLFTLPDLAKYKFAPNVQKKRERSRMPNKIIRKISLEKCLF